MLRAGRKRRSGDWRRSQPIGSDRPWDAIILLTLPLYAESFAFCKAGLPLWLSMGVDDCNVGTLNSDCCGSCPSLGGVASVMYAWIKMEKTESKESARYL